MGSAILFYSHALLPMITIGIKFIFYAHTNMHVYTLDYNNLFVFLLKGALVCILKKFNSRFLHLSLTDHLFLLIPFHSEWCSIPQRGCTIICLINAV